ncbi:helix-turn-helix domain-containing protein [Methylobacillus flagellatus]|uniref:helix-turn-helix domain-containing protein n=1 Tax=Methylobacillus flagellatus TaxID=405 RepID=UPI0006622218|nr:helix-turn-helix transcriptional regulator [Methylobacillus flagellatus]
MIHERLKTEREALGLSQQALADQLGVSLRSQQNYEAGKRVPDGEYLAAIASLGADVLYILTGQRNSAAPAESALSKGDRVLLENFHAAPEQVQAGVKTTLGAFAPVAGKHKKAG